jgi:hypothetical protein
MPIMGATSMAFLEAVGSKKAAAGKAAAIVLAAAGF